MTTDLFFLKLLTDTLEGSYDYPTTEKDNKKDLHNVNSNNIKYTLTYNDSHINVKRTNGECFINGNRVSLEVFSKAVKIINGVGLVKDKISLITSLTDKYLEEKKKMEESKRLDEEIYKAKRIQTLQDQYSKMSEDLLKLKEEIENLKK